MNLEHDKLTNMKPIIFWTCKLCWLLPYIFNDITLRAIFTRSIIFLIGFVVSDQYTLLAYLFNRRSRYLNESLRWIIFQLVLGKQFYWQSTPFLVISNITKALSNIWECIHPPWTCNPSMLSDRFAISSRECHLCVF